LVTDFVLLHSIFKSISLLIYRLIQINLINYAILSNQYVFFNFPLTSLKPAEIETSSENEIFYKKKNNLIIKNLE